MARSARNCERLANDQRRALNHPLRLRILELHKWERGQPLTVEELTAALAATSEYRDVSSAEVEYQRKCLQDAQLLSA
jgi:DNA-binding transcriptional ArsR family regulator